MYFRFVPKNTLYMLEATVYLGASLFFGLLAIYVYQQHNRSKTQSVRTVLVPLHVDRKAILDQKKLAVADRRAGLNNPEVNQPKDSSPTHSEPEARQNETITDTAEDGFGEDLGAALTLTQKMTTPKRAGVSSRSRFGALQDAAAELRDVYNKNNSI